jgi:hypothetical protein
MQRFCFTPWGLLATASSMVTKASFMSCLFAHEITHERGTPLLSTRLWRFVPSLPLSAGLLPVVPPRVPLPLRRQAPGFVNFRIGSKLILECDQSRLGICPSLSYLSDVMYTLLYHYDRYNGQQLIIYVHYNGHPYIQLHD